MVQHVKVSNCTTKGISLAGYSVIHENEVTGMTSAATDAVDLSYGSVERNNIHDNACPGLVVGVTNQSTVAFNRISKNTGATSDGIQVSTYGSAIHNNTIDANGRDGIRRTSTHGVVWVVRNNMLTNNGGYGLYMGANACAGAAFDGNGYYNNTSGLRYQAALETGACSSAPYRYVLDKIMTANPYLDQPNGDYRLNADSDGGGMARAGGSPGTLPGIGTTGYIDLGAYQHADPSCSGGGGAHACVQ
jgi:hypothetical protein